MSESVQRDDQWSLLHDMVYFRYDVQRPALQAEGLIKVHLLVKRNSDIIQMHGTTIKTRKDCFGFEGRE
jgi:hypothetical protein